MLRTKLLYALTHCSAIDTDFTAATWSAADLEEASDDENEAQPLTTGPADNLDEEYPGADVGSPMFL